MMEHVIGDQIYGGLARFCSVLCRVMKVSYCFFFLFQFHLYAFIVYSAKLCASMKSFGVKMLVEEDSTNERLHPR